MRLCDGEEPKTARCERGGAEPMLTREKHARCGQARCGRIGEKPGGEKGEWRCAVRTVTPGTHKGKTSGGAGGWTEKTARKSGPCDGGRGYQRYSVSMIMSGMVTTEKRVLTVTRLEP